MKYNIKWTYDEYEFYNARMLQALLISLIGKEKADAIHEEILKEISEHQAKDRFIEKTLKAMEEKSGGKNE